METLVEIVDIKEIQNKEKEISKILKKLKGNRIEKIELNDKGNLAIFYKLFEYGPRYAVKQVSKKKYKNLDEFIERFSYFQSGKDLYCGYGGPRLKKEWVVDLENVWLAFFEC